MSNAQSAGAYHSESADARARVSVLAPGRYAEWDELVRRSAHGTLFHSSWWLAAAGGTVEILVVEENGRLIAGLPVCRRLKRGVRLIERPPLTPYLGPVFDLANIASLSKAHGRMRHAGNALAAAILGFDLAVYGTGPNPPDLQGFLWHGFRGELGYTFVVPARTTADELLAAMSTTLRPLIENRKGLLVERSEDFNAFLAVQRLTFKRRSMMSPVDERVATSLWRAAHARGQATLYLARAGDRLRELAGSASANSGNPAAGICVVHDSRSSYQLMAGFDPEQQSTGAITLLEWTAIQDALAAGRDYDFEGSVIRGVEAHYRRMGATAIPIYSLTKAANWKGGLALRWLAYKYSGGG